jgi:hypothetical protein
LSHVDGRRALFYKQDEKKVTNYENEKEKARS